MTKILLMTFLLAVSTSAYAQQIAGKAIAYEPDKIMIDGQRILLWGIDAIDRDQSCWLEERMWDCRAVAHRALQILVDIGTVTCQRVDEVEVYGRMWGVCHVNGLDINEEMVRSGMAFAYRPQSDHYVAAEDAARENAAGLWKSKFVFPWEKRAQRDQGEVNR